MGDPRTIEIFSSEHEKICFVNGPFEVFDDKKSLGGDRRQSRSRQQEP
jgi:hypothetical protein